jgi:hypothetical protein
MLQPKLLSAFTALAMVTLAVGAGSSQAAPVAINFGTLTPTNNTCATAAAGFTGEVCTNGLQFTANGGNTFTATGYSDQFTTAAALTLKLDPPQFSRRERPR